MAPALAPSVVFASPVLAAPGYRLKPIDGAALEDAAEAAGGILVTVEDHYAEGGLGDAVLVAVAGKNVSVVKLAVGSIPRSGVPRELLERYGIGRRASAERVRKILKER